MNTKRSKVPNNVHIYTFTAIPPTSKFHSAFLYGHALLGYVSRAHEIEICPSSVVRQSSVVRRPSSVRVAIISEPNARISFKFWLLLPLIHTLGSFFNFLTFFFIFYEYFSFSLTRDPMGAKISKSFSSYNSQPKVFKLLLIFFPMVLTKLCLEFLKFGKLKF